MVGDMASEVAHEALLREWPRLREWLQEDREGRKLGRNVAEAAAEWQRLGKDPEARYRGARLGATLDWSRTHQAELNPLEREFVAAGQAHHDAALRRSKRRNRVLAALVAFTLLAGTLAFLQRSTAQHQALVSKANSLAAEATARAPTQLDLALLLAVEGHRMNDSVATKASLLINEAKTGIVCPTLGKQGLDFLGFHLHKVESWRWKGRFYLQRWPSHKAMTSIRAKIKAATDRANVGKSLDVVVKDLNRTLAAWGNHYRRGNSARKFAIIDSYVHERLAILMSHKHGLTGGNWGRRYNPAWLKRLGVHRLSGTVRYATAHA